jgi:hypothetical protein
LTTESPFPKITLALQDASMKSAPSPDVRLPFSVSLLRSARFWETRRIVYNLILFVITLIWVAASWPHFRPALTPATLLPLTALALLANLCYFAVYLLEIPLLRSSLQSSWLRWRWVVWTLGTVFAVVFENYWIADEIFPYLR